MAALIGPREEIRPPGRSEARATAMMLLAGAVLIAITLVLPHPDAGHPLAVAATGLGMAAVGGACWFSSERVPLILVHVLLAGSAVAASALMVESGLAVGQYTSIFIWSTLISAYFFSRRTAIIHVAFLLAVYAGSLVVIESTGGYSGVTRWALTAVTLVVLLFFTGNLVSRGQRADGRARRFFDLSQDMLCTMDREGRCVEANAAWERILGYRPVEMRGRDMLGFTHPDDHAHAIEAARQVFAGEVSNGLETRVQAKDGSWHWMRTSSVFQAEEGLVYARSSDVTGLKVVEAEREALIAEVQKLARSDALTGLPNRRALDDQLPREMARALRSGEGLCLAIIDIDNFKAYNDSHGHLAGDRVLRECAGAWDESLRGEDTILRFGGEEFLVILPECDLEDAFEIIERLRAATPQEQTCSAGLAAWKPGESVDDLVGRADVALYEAKGSGRDRLVSAAD